MELFLMQHGEAVAEEVDPERPISEVGRASVAAVAGHAAACGIGIDRIVHSGKLRARQTAELLAEVLGCTTVEAVDGLKPGDDVRAAKAALVDDSDASLAVVGHLPFLDRFASLLVAGDPAAHVVAFRNGGLVKLVPADARFAVEWLVTPEVAHS